jgi:hypothetical protein
MKYLRKMFLALFFLPSLLLAQATFDPDSGITNTQVLEETIPLTKTAEGLFTLQLPVGGQPLNLLIDTSLSAMVIFEDQISPDLLKKTEHPVSLRVLGDQLNGVAATTNTLGLKNLQIVIANRQDYAQIAGQSMQGIDGILGLYHDRPDGYVESEATVDVPMLQMQPRICMMEFDFNPNGPAGLSVGSMPLIGGVSEHLLINSYVTGQKNEKYPYNNSFTDISIPFVASSTVAEVGFDLDQDRIQLVPSSTLTDRVILDTSIAQKLGYDATSQSWNAVTQIELYFWPRGSDNLIDVVSELSVENITVADLGNADYQAILGLDYWQGYVVGFDSLDYQSGGPLGVVSLLKREDITEPSPVIVDHRLIKMPGLNSHADDTFGDISDDGQTIVFQSNRTGNFDVYVYRFGEGLLELSSLNSLAMDAEPSISGDGQWLAFQSNRNGYFELYLYNIGTQSLVELPGLNRAEEQNLSPTLNADATRLAFRRDELNEATAQIDSNLYIYDIANQSLEPLILNGSESNPSLSGNLLGFDRSDGNVHLFDLDSNQLVDLPTAVKSPYFEGGNNLSGDFMVFHSTQNNPNLQQRGIDLFLFERSSQELLHLPGLNSSFTDGFPALSQNAQHILFQSNRAGGEGGYDIYLYQRDLEDDRPNEVTTPYWEDGYVVDVNGAPLAGATVKVIDADGNIVVEAKTDSEGDFKVQIPAGTKLPLRTETADGKVVVDETGDSTYVRDFQLGNLKFTNVGVEDTAQSGFKTNIRFDVETDAPNYNVKVDVLLVPLNGNASDLDYSQLESLVSGDESYHFTSLLIDKLGHHEKEKGVIVRKEFNRTTTITYEPLSDNKKAHVEHSFEVPEIKAGTYAAVFSVNTIGFGEEQGEEIGNSEQNSMVAPASILIGNPDKPNLRILFAELVNNAFELPVAEDDDKKKYAPQLQLNMEVESMGLDTVDPVDISFELKIDDVNYPLSFLRPDKDGNPILVPKMTYEKECQPNVDGVEHCASLFRQKPKGYTYALYVNNAAYNKLFEKQSDASVELVIKIDQENKISEWEDNKSDNVKRLSVLYLAPQAKRQTRKITDKDLKSTKYPTEIFNYKYQKKWGNDTFAAGFEVGPQASIREDDIFGAPIPTAMNFDAWNEIWAIIFRTQQTIFGAGALINFDIDDLGGSEVFVKFEVLNEVIRGEQYNLVKIKKKCDEKCQTCQKKYSLGSKGSRRCRVNVPGIIWSSQNNKGDEKWRINKKVPEEPWSFKYPLWALTFKVTAQIDLECGISGVIEIAENNTLAIEVGPYGKLELEATAGIGKDVNIGFADAKMYAGIIGEIALIDSALAIIASLQILPTYPMAAIRLETPLTIESLNGKLSFFLEKKLKFAGVKLEPEPKKKEIFNWDGYELVLQILPPVLLPAAGIDTFKVWSQKKSGEFTAEKIDVDLTDNQKSVYYEMSDDWIKNSEIKIEGFAKFYGTDRVLSSYKSAYMHTYDYTDKFDFKLFTNGGEASVYLYVDGAEESGVNANNDQNQIPLFEKVTDTANSKKQVVVASGIHKFVVNYTPDEQNECPKVKLVWGKNDISEEFLKRCGEAEEVKLSEAEVEAGVIEVVGVDTGKRKGKQVICKANGKVGIVIDNICKFTDNTDSKTYSYIRRKNTYEWVDYNKPYNKYFPRNAVRTGQKYICKGGAYNNPNGVSVGIVSYNPFNGKSKCEFFDTTASDVSIVTYYSSFDVLVDNGNIYVIDVSSSEPDNDPYGIGKTIPITVEFNEPVIVEGQPLLYLENDSNDDVKAIYSKGSSTKTLTFEYTIVAGDNTIVGVLRAIRIALGDYDSILGTKDSKSVNLALPKPGTIGSLSYNKEFVIDTTAPTVTNSTIKEVTAIITNTRTSDGIDCAILRSGRVKCWESYTVPTFAWEVKDLSDVIDVVTAGYYGCALTKSGMVKCWHEDSTVDVNGLSSGVIAIAAKRGFHKSRFYAITSSGIVKTWDEKNSPKKIDGLTNVKALAIVDSHGCALTKSDGVKCWGSNNYGQLGNGTYKKSDTPVDVSDLSRVTAIALGQEHSCALTMSDGVKCWGRNQFGQLGGTEILGYSSSNSVDNYNKNNKNTPIGIKGTKDATAIASGTYHTCVLTDLDGVKCWGGTALSKDGSMFDVNGLNIGVTAIALRGGHSCALTGGGVKCWGFNTDGELGNGLNINSNIAVNVLGLKNGVTAIEAGENYNCALTSNGGVKCWGGSYDRYEVRDVLDKFLGVSSSDHNRNYYVDDVIKITVPFSEQVFVKGTPKLVLETGAVDMKADYSEGTGTNTLTFEYKISGGNSTDLDYVDSNALILTDKATIKDYAGNNAILYLPTPGTEGSLSANKDLKVETTSVSNVFSHNKDGIYGIKNTYIDGNVSDAETIYVEVLFSDLVTVDGTPKLRLKIGDSEKESLANYSKGSKTKTLTFEYKVAPGDFGVLKTLPLLKHCKHKF